MFMCYYVVVLELVFIMVFFFFFKQKTAYEMRISDWSSDVCSSDLIDDEHRDEALRILFEKGIAALLARDQADLDAAIVEPLQVQRDANAKADRKSVV